MVHIPTFIRRPLNIHGFVLSTYKLHSNHVHSIYSVNYVTNIYYVNYQKSVEFVRTIFLVCWCKRNGDVDRAILIGGPDINMKLYFIYSAILCR